MADEKEVIMSSSGDEVREFKESFLWKDIQGELLDLGERTSAEYDLVGESRIEDEVKIYPTTAETLIHLGEIKGRRKAIIYFLSIPDILLQNLEVQNLEDQENDS